MFSRTTTGIRVPIVEETLDYNHGCSPTDCETRENPMTEQQDARHLLERAERAATAGDLVSADELLRGAARIQEQELGAHHPDLASTLNNLAIVAEKTGSSSEAESFYRRAAAITAAALPSDHPMTVASRQNLEDFCRARGLSVDAPAVTTPTRDARREGNAFRV